MWPAGVVRAAATHPSNWRSLSALDAWLKRHNIPGIMGLAPSRELRQRVALREQALLERGGFVVAPGPDQAVPAQGPSAEVGLRTIPPRETGGNLDIKQLSKGARLMLPVSLSYDHRVLDGATAARFTSLLVSVLSDIRKLIL